MAHTITLTHDVELNHKEFCGGCPCNQSLCTMDFGDRVYVWYDSDSGEIIDESKVNSALSISEWSYHTKRPQKCIDELG